MIQMILSICALIVIMIILYLCLNRDGLAEYFSELKIEVKYVKDLNSNIDLILEQYIQEDHYAIAVIESYNIWRDEEKAGTKHGKAYDFARHTYAMWKQRENTLKN